jgi:hypothetical protein
LKVRSAIEKELGAREISLSDVFICDLYFDRVSMDLTLKLVPGRAIMILPYRGKEEERGRGERGREDERR